MPSVADAVFMARVTKGRQATIIILGEVVQNGPENGQARLLVRAIYAC